MSCAENCCINSCQHLQRFVSAWCALLQLDLPLSVDALDSMVYHFDLLFPSTCAIQRREKNYSPRWARSPHWPIARPSHQVSGTSHRSRWASAREPLPPRRRNRQIEPKKNRFRRKAGILRKRTKELVSKHSAKREPSSSRRAERIQASLWKRLFFFFLVWFASYRRTR